MKGYEKFQLALAQAAKEHIFPHEGEEIESFGKVIQNHLFDLDGPRQLSRPTNARQQYFWRLFQGFIEISKSLETLKDLGVYIRRFPFQNTRISRERYLQFHVEAHYSEMYILRDRLTRYAKLVERQFRKDSRVSDVPRRCQALNDSITKSLNGVVDIRRRHVHEARFSDDGIDRLGTITLLSQGKDKFSKLMQQYYSDEFSRIRKRWRDVMKKNLDAIRVLLDAFFEIIYLIVFDEQTKTLRYPKGART